MTEYAGSPERRWPPLQTLPALRVEPAPATVVVVSAHAHDEVVAVGGLLAALAAAGAYVRLIAVTDATPGVLPVETALGKLGVRELSIERLGMEAGRVAAAEAEHAGITATVVRTIARAAANGPVWCVAPWSGDGDADHAAAGHAAALGAAGTARLLSYPVSMWQWASPGDPRVPWWSVRRVDLPAEVRTAKAEVLAPPHGERFPRGAELVFDRDA